MRSFDIEGDKFLKRFATNTEESSEDDIRYQKISIKSFAKTFVIDPAQPIHYRWLLVISLAVSYNIIFIIGRGIFWNLHNYWSAIWYTIDYICDVIYLLDMIANSRTGYLEQGILIRDTRRLLTHYLSSVAFKLDVISILPTDLAYFYLPPRCQTNRVPCPILIRLNKLLRFHRLAQFFDRTESATNFPFAFRISKLIFYILVIIHWNSCIYFAISYAIGFGSDRWVYQPTNAVKELGQLVPPSGVSSDLLQQFGSHTETSNANINSDGPIKSDSIIGLQSDLNMANDSLVHQYIFCFYWSTLTLTTIGEVPMPERDEEYLFVVIDFLIGLLIFATIVGNIGSMITNMNAARAEFQHKMDSVKQWMKFRKVNKELEDRIIKWFDYLWDNRQTLDEDAVTAILPDRLKAETAIYVHLETLKRVQLFQDCEPGLLVQLVLKLKLQVFSPGDFICKVGDVGKEMYIVKRGELNVLSEDCQTVYGKLTDGSVFGELSILNISGVRTRNRRTASVRSVGYSDLFALSKQDLWQVLEDYPDAKTMLVDRGKEILRKDGLLIEENAEPGEPPATASSIGHNPCCIHSAPARTPSLFGLTGDSNQIENLQANQAIISMMSSDQASSRPAYQRQNSQISSRASIRQRPSLHVVDESLQSVDTATKRNAFRDSMKNYRGQMMKKSLSFALDTHVLPISRNSSVTSDNGKGFQMIANRIRQQDSDPTGADRVTANLQKLDRSHSIARILQRRKTRTWTIDSATGRQSVNIDTAKLVEKMEMLCSEIRQIQLETTKCLSRLDNLMADNSMDVTFPSRANDYILSLSDTLVQSEVKPRINLEDSADEVMDLSESEISLGSTRKNQATSRVAINLSEMEESNA